MRIIKTTFDIHNEHATVTLTTWPLFQAQITCQS